MREIKNIDGIKVIYKDDVITVKESYRIEYPEGAPFCKRLKEEEPIPYTRTVESWTKELLAHNFLYYLGLYVEHTADADIDENEKWYRLLAYDIIYVVYSIIYYVSRFFCSLR